jgi:Homeodomain-like domain
VRLGWTRAEEADTVLVELGLVEQRYRAVLVVLDDGATVVDVARRCGVARQTVHNLLNACSVTPPPSVNAGTPSERWGVMYAARFARRVHVPQECPEGRHLHP